MERVAERTIDLEGLLETRVPAAYRLARAILLDDDEAADAVQDACVAAWRGQRALRDVERFDAWFDRIVINLCRDALRRRRRIPAIAAYGTPTAVPVAPSDPRDIDLDAALDALDLDHRVVVLLRYWRDLTVDDIAARLDIPAGTVKSRLHYALRSMRERLEASDGRA